MDVNKDVMFDKSSMYKNNFRIKLQFEDNIFSIKYIQIELDILNIIDYE